MPQIEKTQLNGVEYHGKMIPQRAPAMELADMRDFGVVASEKFFAPSVIAHQLHIGVEIRF